MNMSMKTLKMIQLALLIAIIALMAFTPIGFIRTPGLEITLIGIPVVVGAVLLGPAGGAILGAAFGLCSFLQCFGLSLFGATLLAINPLLIRSSSFCSNANSIVDLILSASSPLIG